jgi:uncharacterized SAM-binding protein YcdF (DUF218 family)
MRLLHLFSLRLFRFVLAGVFAWSLLAWGAARALIVHARLAHAEAIVVLSGSSAYLERTKKAAELFHEGRAPLVILTNDNTRGGWSSALQRNPYFVERAVEELQKAGVPPEKINILPGFASSTRDEAMILREYALERGLHSLLLVTSPYHSRRALWTFRRSFTGTGASIGVEIAPSSALTPSAVLWWLQIRGWRTVGSEYVKLIYYWFKYY